ncbi:putative ATPase [Kribbella sp. VKM Ac-2569]|uniref:helix-turn-helix transcriptional regulator n=1 Tax=Kribbella sp. VKM Ac-2569 TaxID=2512220 RepID=UPI0010D25FC2|nr:LuxR family transcriptional regulator [Kribbella sp. VKM Ac-2569]RZT28539.1 putative ATPase [Kribbella sp. VKM Ac-2569]
MGVVRVKADLRLAGRAGELQLLADALAAAAGGVPCAVVVHGEAGVGKTQLVRAASDTLPPDVQVLWGACVHFCHASVPFAPVTGALQGWLTQADGAARADLLFGADDLAALLPSLGQSQANEPGRLLPLIDLVFSRLADRASTVVVIDDLHWADRSSLDVLAYLITGFRDRRLAVLATCRDEHLGEGHPLHTWLADMRRMPGFQEVHLDRLDLAATETQIAGLLGRQVDIGLAVQVHERSCGNPYLTELLVRGLSGTEPSLPSAAPTALRDALLASWHGLTEPARQVTRILAAGGRPIDLAVLAGVSSTHRVAKSQLSACLTEARDHGVLRPDDRHRPWFRHPLLADILYNETPPDDAARLHAAYVRVLCSRPEVAPARAAAELAVHSHRAGMTDDAYRWSLIAAENAAELHATAEEAIHLERACSLWAHVSPNVRGAPAARVDLLSRASSACGRGGLLDSAVRLAAEALILVDRNVEPLRASTLLLAHWRAMYRRWAPETTVTDDLIQAVRLTDAAPDSAERALALGALAFAERVDRLHDEAATHAEDAVETARRSRSQLALAAALSTRAFVNFADFASNPLSDAEEAERLARSCGSTEWLEAAAIQRVRCLRKLGRDGEATAVAKAVFEEALAAGSEWSYHLASYAADGLLDDGRWDDCRELLRQALAARCGGIAGASVRLIAAQLATRCGRTTEAEQHLARALELISADTANHHVALTIAAAEVFMASTGPQKSLQWLQSRIDVADAAYIEGLLVDFAHAAAETAQAARDAGDTRGAAQAAAMLQDLLGKWPHEPFTTWRPEDADTTMGKALLDAEIARCRGDSGQAELWRQAADRCHAAGMPWQEAVSRLQCAEAILATGPPTSTVSNLLRQAHKTAVKLGAKPLQTQVESLARIARVNLRHPVPIGGAAQMPKPLAGLTERERQILAFLVAGRSNGEIAQELVISDKTVSVHVSNILRKTGTSSRVEAAALAERLAGHHRS